MVSEQRETDLYRWRTRQRWLWQCGKLDRTIERGLRAVGFPLETEECEWERAFARVATAGDDGTACRYPHREPDCGCKRSGSSDRPAPSPGTAKTD